MDPQRWEQIQALFHEVADLPAAEQHAVLAARCAGDADLAAEVRHLLEEDARGESVLDRGLAQVAGRMLGEEEAESLPKEFGPYRVKQRLGEGGMGVVFLAERPDLQNLVAIKVLRDAWLSPARRERFTSEQRLLAQLNHPAIARLYDAGALPNGTPWFAMEYVEGVPLHDYCTANRCTLPQTLALFRAVCEAVLHAHQRAVMHRDLKPSNILVTRDGAVKLLDFGIAKPLESLDSPATATRTDMRLMTPAYAAPEQVRGGQLGVHTDIYALGVILYELLVGRPPFDLADKTPGEVDRIVAELEAEKPSLAVRRAEGADAAARLRGGASWSDLDVLCLTAMQKDPARRYRTVDSLIRDVDHYLRGEPLEARPDTAGYRLRKFVRRHWQAVSVTAVTLAIVIGLVAFYTVRLTAARNAAVAEAERTRRIQEFMTRLFEGDDESAGPEDTLRVVSLVGRGVREARALDAEPAIQAELYQTLAGIYEQLGHFDRADSLASEALAIRRARLGATHPDVAKSLVALGGLRVDQSRLDEAEKLVREGLAISRGGRRPDIAGQARAMTALGQVLENRGDYTQAIAVLTEAARLDSTAGLPPWDLSATLTQLANCHFYAGNYAVSDSLNRRVLALDRQLHGERHPDVASDLINLGAIQQELGHYAASERHYREALGIYRGWYGEDHYETAAALTMIARVLIHEKRFADASEMLTRALEIRRRVYGPDHPNVASTLNELGRIAQGEGRLDEAEAHYRRMAEIYRKAYPGGHYLIGIALANLGGLYIDRRQYTVAERLLREATRRYAETLPADHLYLGIVRIRLGRALLRQGRYAEAEKETLAGYGIVSRQTDPAVSWLQGARVDLIDAYDRLEQPEKAAKFRAELAQARADSAAAARVRG